MRNIVRPKHHLVRKIVGAAVGPKLTYRGGPLIANVQVTTIFWGSAWAGDPLRAQLDAFFDFVVTSSLIDQLAEYNVAGFTIGHGSHAASVLVSGNPPSTVDDTQIQTFVASQISSGAVPAQNANSLYFVFVPSGVTVTLQGSSSCQAFCGYHNTPDNKLFYALMPYADCPGCQLGPSVFDSMTVIASHELCEAITDPIPGQGWYDDANGEIGDICEGSTKTIGKGATAKAGTTSFTVSVNPQSVVVDGSAPVNLTVTLTPAGAATPPPPPPGTVSYVVQKEWSNAQDACV
jgi:hypothetical protein